MATEVAVRPRETLSVELNGINVITDAERKGRPRDLFWPWCAANIAVLGISYGSFLLGFGVSFWQATIAGLVGTILSFLLVGFVSLAGKRGSAPTMVLSRAAYGVQGGKIPAALSYILLVGWETVLVSLATLATATVFGRLGWGGGDATKIVAFLLVACVVVFSGIFGAAVAPVLLVVYGLLLAASDQKLNQAIGADPIGALTTLLPTWYLVLFALVAIGGLIGGAVLDIYSSGLALLTLGLKVPRWTAAGIDGVIMILRTIYVVWFASNFIGPFEGFLITLGVPISAWCGVFIADLLLRKRDYAEADLYDSRGRYGPVSWVAVGTTLVATFLGWGLVTNSFAEWLSWQGYLLDPLGFGPQGKGGLPRRWFESTALFQACFSLGRRARLAMVAAVRTLRDECARFEHASTQLDPFGTEERF